MHSFKHGPADGWASGRRGSHSRVKHIPSRRSHTASPQGQPQLMRSSFTSTRRRSVLQPHRSRASNRSRVTGQPTPGVITTATVISNVIKPALSSAPVASGGHHRQKLPGGALSTAAATSRHGRGNALLMSEPAVAASLGTAPAACGGPS